MSWLRWARVRGLTEGLFQRGRVEGLGDEARDKAVRPQDYGFAANAVEGDGLKIEVGGHTIIMRLDRASERPQLDDYEVAVWHKEGHMVRLRAGRVVQVDCDVYQVNTKHYTVNATEGADFNTPAVNASGNMTAAATVQGQTVAGQSVQAATSLKVSSKEVLGHHHGNVSNGGGISADF